MICAFLREYSLIMLHYILSPAAVAAASAAAGYIAWLAQLFS